MGGQNEVEKIMDKQLVYIAQYYSQYSKEWCNCTTKAGNALHKTKGQAMKKIEGCREGRVVEYELVPTGQVFTDE